MEPGAEAEVEEPGSEIELRGTIKSMAAVEEAAQCVRSLVMEGSIEELTTSFRTDFTATIGFVWGSLS